MRAEGVPLFFSPSPFHAADLEEQAKEVEERKRGLAGEHLETMRAAHRNIKAALEDLSKNLYDVQQVRTHAHTPFAEEEGGCQLNHSEIIMQRTAHHTATIPHLQLFQLCEEYALFTAKIELMHLAGDLTHLEEEWLNLIEVG